MKLTYWYARCENDSAHYSIRARTRQEARVLRGAACDGVENAYGPVVKVVVTYRDGFDLMYECLTDMGEVPRQEHLSTERSIVLQLGS